MQLENKIISCTLLIIKKGAKKKGELERPYFPLLLFTVEKFTTHRVLGF